MDNELSSEGRLAVQLTANKLQVYKPKAIYSSDFMRDTETAHIVASRLNISNIETDYDARTWDTGQFSGQPEEKVNKIIEDIYKNPSRSAPGGSESMNDFAERWIAFLEARVRQAADIPEMRPILVVTHGRNLAMAHSHYEGVNTWEAAMPLPAGFAVIRANDDMSLSMEFMTESEPISRDV